MRPIIVFLFALLLAGCGDNDAPPVPDAGATAAAPSEPPPTACLPWPDCNIDAGAP